jgi:hypothetical protein
LSLAGFRVELFVRKNASPLEKRAQMLNAAERTVIDEVAHKSFDAWTFEHEHHGLLREKNAMPVKAGRASPQGAPWRGSARLARASLAKHHLLRRAGEF